MELIFELDHFGSFGRLEPGLQCISDFVGGLKMHDIRQHRSGDCRANRRREILVGDEPFVVGGVGITVFDFLSD